MKTLMTTTLVLLLACVFVVGAIAQDDGQTQKKQQKLNFEDANGADGNGEINRHVYKDDDGGPHGPIGPGPDDAEKIFVDEDGDGFADNGRAQQGDLSGTLVRTENKKGARNQDQTGGCDDIDGEDKAMGDDGQGSMTGTQDGQNNVYGPGGDAPAMGDGVGPNDGIGFGEAETEVEEGDGDMTRNRGKGVK